MPVVKQEIRAPNFQPGEWLNTSPLTLADLRGHVILVDFWDYCCISCLRTLPYQCEWWRRYQQHGLVIVGVHTPKYAFERERANVERALAEYEITYPILMDNERKTWNSWATRYWPTKYLVDADGCLRYFHFGEGYYDQIEHAIQRALKLRQPDLVLPEILTPLRPMDAPDTTCYRATNELYLGYQRGYLGNRERRHPDLTVAYAEPGEMKPEVPYVSGYWKNGREAVTLEVEDGAVLIRYRAREANLIAQPPRDGVGIIIVEQDGAPLPSDACGDDVTPEGGEMIACITEPRLYNLVKNDRFGEHLLRLRVRTPGVSIYGFNFVSDCVAEAPEHEQAA